MVAVKHSDGSVARYGEITPYVKSGAAVKKGQQIGVLKANNIDGGTMLHLELYRGTASGSLTGRDDPVQPWMDYLGGKHAAPL